MKVTMGPLGKVGTYICVIHTDVVSGCPGGWLLRADSDWMEGGLIKESIRDLRTLLLASPEPHEMLG